MSKSDTDFIGYIIIALLLSGLWSHKLVSANTVHYVKYFGMTLLALVVVAIVVKLVQKLPKTRKSSVDTMTGLEFERHVAMLLKANGYRHVKLTEVYDLGVDIVAEKDGTTWGVQVKRYSGLVGADAVRQVVTALPMYHCSKAMVVTNSTFSRPAISLADANSCMLIDRAKLNSFLKG